MKQNLSIWFKAVFLLVVFLLSTVTGFACSVGIDMGFNRSHQHDKSTGIFHKEVTHNHHHSFHYHKAEKNAYQKSHDKGNCCNDEVIKCNSINKLSPPSLGSNFIFIIAFFSYFYPTGALAYSTVIVSDKYFIRSYHPPISEIRLAIQSFQI